MPISFARPFGFKRHVSKSLSSILLFLAVCNSAARCDDVRKVEGVWQGVVLKNGAVHRFVTLQIHRDWNQKYIGAMTIDGVRYDLNNAHVNVSNVMLRLKGKFGGQAVSLECKLDGDKQRLVGEWCDGAEKLPLVIGRSGYLYISATPATATTSIIEGKSVVAAPTRHIEGKSVVAATTRGSTKKRERPINVILPYEQRPVVFSNRKAKIDFGGVLSVPPGKGPFPAVLLLGGAGPADADSSYGDDYRPYMDLADHLTRLGFAVLRVNTRGVLGSGGGNYYMATLSDLAEDALSAIDFLEGVPAIDSKRIGMLGWSGGCLVASIAATRRPQTAFVVMMGTPFTDGDKYYQAIDSQSPAWEQAHRSLCYIVKTEKIPVLGIIRMRLVIRSWLWAQGFQNTDDLKVERYISPTINTPWGRDFLVHDPLAIVRSLKCPILALFGMKDEQIPPKVHVPPAQKVLCEAGNPISELVELPNLGHSFREDGSRNEEDEGSASLSPVLMEKVSTWLKRSALCDLPLPTSAAKVQSKK